MRWGGLLDFEKWVLPYLLTRTVRVLVFQDCKIISRFSSAYFSLHSTPGKSMKPSVRGCAWNHEKQIRP